MNEIDLVKAKAARLTAEDIHAEIERCERGCVVAASISALKRFKTRLEIMRAELRRRKIIGTSARLHARQDRSPLGRKTELSRTRANPARINGCSRQAVAACHQ